MNALRGLGMCAPSPLQLHFADFLADDELGVEGALEVGEVSSMVTASFSGVTVTTSSWGNGIVVMMCASEGSVVYVIFLCAVLYSFVCCAVCRSLVVAGCYLYAVWRVSFVSCVVCIVCRYPVCYYRYCVDVLHRCGQTEQQG